MSMFEAPLMFREPFKYNIVLCAPIVMLKLSHNDKEMLTRGQGVRFQYCLTGCATRGVNSEAYHVGGQRTGGLAGSTRDSGRGKGRGRWDRLR